ncbi:MraY family glycosyltransferase [Marinococcus sp. PL1-022]|uniref:glycosyltransferase family 4 protein n=1 Tax=Marinococcus sp. PL1-022 TaxID=3095363 RepID=UPI0029C4ED1B|nr:MraY family glycosyltransferase [Marinococcus sp. PL1-022]MDX6154086.1 MraY family glycosyltransferase [Marinococcus sp. PL1-022]
MITAIALVSCFLTALILTPLVKKLAFLIGATDNPNDRKVHTGEMARLGGLAIYVSFILGLFILKPENEYLPFIFAGGTLVFLIGALDDIKEQSAKVKLIAQLAAAIIVIVGGVQLEFINLPFGGVLELGFLSIPITLLWIIGITNAINLIDGLDGLSAGVSAIVLATISALSIVQGDIFIVAMAIALLGGTLGFLVHNFHPAKLFMGDSGALFLGFMIAVIALLGFKNVTVFSLIVPLLILAVPISDTLFAIIRRALQKQSFSTPDKSHLHHCLLRLGYSHRQTVLIIYLISAICSVAAVVFTLSTLWVSIVALLVMIIAIEILAESVGLVSNSYKPFLRFLKKISGGTKE